MRTASSRVAAILPAGSGACIVHELLARHIAGYQCHTYNPRLEYIPFLLPSYRRRAGEIVHAPPDHAVLVTPRRSRLVVTLHNYYLDAPFAALSSLKQRLHYRTDLRWLTRRALARADVVTAVSQFTADLVADDLGLTRAIRVIPNGIDVHRFHPTGRSHAGVRVLYCGNLSRRKGAHLLPAIARGLDAGVELWLACGLRGGRSPERWPPNVKLLGRIPHDGMPRLYNEVDVLLMPTLREGLSLAVVEAMACGLPVVASDCSSLPEQIVDAKGGFLVRPQDVDGFIDRINALARSPTLRFRMGQYNRERAQALYKDEDMVAAYAALFEEVSDFMT